MFTFAINSNAQEISDNTIGLRAGNYYGLSYQKKLSTDTRAEIGLTYWSYSTYSDTKVDAYYHKVFPMKSAENMNWYAGAGGGAGIWKYDSRYYDSSYDYSDSGTYFFVGGTVGLEYKFDFPLLLSLDLRPELTFGNFYNGLHFNGGLGIRYIL